VPVPLDLEGRTVRPGDAFTGKVVRWSPDHLPEGLLAQLAHDGWLPEAACGSNIAEVHEIGRIQRRESFMAGAERAESK
jgi:hypothetical protein